LDNDRLPYHSDGTFAGGAIVTRAAKIQLAKEHANEIRRVALAFQQSTPLKFKPGSVVALPALLKAEEGN
jgi:hypothetical protein